MMEVLDSGFREIEHTADSALQVWAPDLPTLFAEAAKGMNTLTGIQLEETKRKTQPIALDAQEYESLLVLFLEEILFYGDHHDLGFDRFEVEINGDFNLRAVLYGAKIVGTQKEIKAVTFHNMKISPTDLGFEVIIVFDV
jgi:SHS2 domain-containing protein